MTSPSETPLDLDVLRATLTKARGYAAKVKKPMFPPASVVQLVDIALRLIRELESRTRTVGDLTARDLGRRVRIADGRVFSLKSLEAYGREYQVILGWALNGYVYVNLDTPVEFLDDEPASAHQRPGERFPSHEQAAQVLGDHETAEGGAVNQSQTCSWGVTRNGEYEPCDKPAVAWQVDEEAPEFGAYPVCPAHTRDGRALTLDDPRRPA